MHADLGLLASAASALPVTKGLETRKATAPALSNGRLVECCIGGNEHLQEAGAAALPSPPLPHTIPAGLLRSSPNSHTPPPTSPRPHTPAPRTHATTIAHVALPDPHPAPQALHSSARGVLAPPPQPLRPTRPPGGATAATGRHSPSSAGRGLRRRAARGGQAACWRAALLVVILVPRRSPFGHFSGVRPQRGEKAARSARWRR